MAELLNQKEGRNGQVEDMRSNVPLMPLGAGHHKPENPALFI